MDLMNEFAKIILPRKYDRVIFLNLKEITNHYVQWNDSGSNLVLPCIGYFKNINKTTILNVYNFSFSLLPLVKYNKKFTCNTLFIEINFLFCWTWFKVYGYVESLDLRINILFRSKWQNSCFFFFFYCGCLIANIISICVCVQFFKIT